MHIEWTRISNFFNTGAAFAFDTVFFLFLNENENHPLFALDEINQINVFHYISTSIFNFFNFSSLKNANFIANVGIKFINLP